MIVQIVGVKKSNYKGRDGKDKTGFNYYGTKAFTQYEQENAECEGVDVVREFSSTDYNIHPGDVVNFEYEPGYEGKATLMNVTMISMSDKPPFDNAPNSADTGKKGGKEVDKS